MRRPLRTSQSWTYGDELQDAFAFLIGLGLPVYAGQLGFPGDDASLAAFGATLAPLTCAAPFSTDANAWRDAGRKVWNWGQKHLGVRDASVVAGELSKTDPVVTYCVYGFHIGCETAIALRKAGFDARYMAGGHYAWKAIGGKVRLFE